MVSPFLEEVMAAAKNPSSGLLKDRKWHFKVQKNCLIGSEFVGTVLPFFLFPSLGRQYSPFSNEDWMLATYPALVTNRSDGVRWAQELLDNQLLVNHLHAKYN